MSMDVGELLEQHLQELGQDPDSVDVDLHQDSYSPEEAGEVMDALRRGVMGRIDPEFREERFGNVIARRISGYDIDYYGRPFFEFGGVVDQMQELREHGVEPRHHHGLVPAYSTDVGMRQQPLDPYTVERQNVLEFLDWVDDAISEKRRGKYDFMTELHDSPENIDTDWAMKWLDERDTVAFDDFNEYAFDENPGFTMGVDEKVYEQVVDEDWPEISGDWTRTDFDAVYDAMLIDLTTTMQGLVQAQDPDERDAFKAKADGYRRLFTKYNPALYGEVVADDHEYTVVTEMEPSKMHRAAKVVRSCVRGDSDRDVFTGWAEDPGTVFQVVGTDDVVQGYTRSFVLEDSDGRPFLGLDTIEVPKRGGADLDAMEEDFEERRGAVKAATLGVVQTMYDLGVDYVAGREARIKFGQRQAYGNTSREITYEKVGDPVSYYAVNRKDGETEVRGFPTEDGTHTVEAYILMENPERF